MYQKLTEKIAGKPEERILSYLMLRSLKQARYSEENVGHFALAATTYTHFTSPIRRYPDLIVHRILKDVLRDSAEMREAETPIGGEPGVKNASAAGLEGRSNLAQRFSAGNTKIADQVLEGRPNRQQGDSDEPRRGRPPHTSQLHTDPVSPWSKRREREPVQFHEGPIPIEELHAIADESSQSERRADEAERELMEWKKARFMQDRIGEDFDGLIVSVTKFGFFVELTDLFVEGLVPLTTLSDDRYTFHENTREIIGQHSRKAFRLGDKVHVLVDRIDPVEKKIQFALLEERPSRGAHSRRKRR
jgi:ribonuclease R